MKYIEKAWCERDAAAAAKSNGAATKKTSSSSSKSSSSRRKPKQAPAPASAAAAKAAPTAAAADPFGFDSITPSASSANYSSWDAFGSTAPAPPAANFQADFGNMNGISSSAAAPAAAPPAPPTMPALQADFGGMNNGTTTATAATPHQPSAAPAATPFQADFGNNFSQPTMVSMPPPPPPSQGQPQQMQSMQQQQQPGQGNFVQTHAGNQPQQQSFQANFNQGMMQPPPPPQQQQQQQPVQQQQPMQQIPFQANFDQGQMMQQHQVQQQQQQPVQQQQPLASTLSPGFQANFDQMPQSSMMPVTQQQQPQQSFSATQQQQQPQQLFQPNFGETMAPQQQQQQQQQQQPPQVNVVPARTQNMQGLGGEITMNQQASGMNSGQFPEQHQQMGNGQQVVTDSNQQMPPAPKQPASTNVQSNDSANAPHIHQNQPQQELQPEAINPNAFQSSDDKKDAFSAFDSLSLEPTNSRGGAKTPVREVGTSATEKPKNLQFTKYKEGQQVLYTNSEGSVMAVIQKVHFDDELEPFYTIILNGREKQTDDAHLSLPNETIQNQPNKPNDESSAKLKETEAMLKNLSESQLMEVQKFIASLQSSIQPAPSISMGITPQEPSVNDMNHSKQQMGEMSHQQVGGVPTQNQAVAAPDNSMPLPQMASFQQSNQTHGMTSNMNGIQTQMNSQQPMLQQQQPQMYARQPTVQQPAPSQSYAQQQSTQVQGMGNTAMPQLSMKQQPLMSNTGSAQAQPQQQVPNQSMMQPMGSSQPYAPSPTMAPTAPPPNNLAPVEKEGNPFDMY